MEENYNAWIAALIALIAGLGGKEIWTFLNNRFKIAKDSEYEHKKIDVDMLRKEMTVENAQRQIEINKAAQTRIIELESQLVQIKVGLSMIITLLEDEFSDRPNIQKGLRHIMNLFELSNNGEANNQQ